MFHPINILCRLLTLYYFLCTWSLASETSDVILFASPVIQYPCMITLRSCHYRNGVACGVITNETISTEITRYL